MDFARCRDVLELRTGCLIIIIIIISEMSSKAKYSKTVRYSAEGAAEIIATEIASEKVTETIANSDSENDMFDSGESVRK